MTSADRPRTRTRSMPPDPVIAEAVDDLVHELAVRLRQISEEIKPRVEKSLAERLPGLHAEHKASGSAARTPWPISAEMTSDVVAVALAQVLADRMPELARLFLVRSDLLPAPGSATNRRKQAAALTGKQRFSLEAWSGYAKRTAPFDPEDYRRAVEALIDRGEELRPVTQADIDALPTD